MTTPFAGRARRTQLVALRIAAQRALRHWPIAVDDLRLVHYGFNATYRVVAADGTRFALRLNVNSRRSPAQLRAETSWVAALADEPDITVPVPQPTVDGEFLAFVPLESFDRDISAVVYSWLPGRMVGDEPTVTQMRAIGALTARLHDHVERWALPPGASLNLFDTALMDDIPRLHLPHPELTVDRLAVIDAAMVQVNELLAAVFARETPRPIHGDLHGWNLMWHQGRLAAFDFDDTGLGVRAQDLAMAAYYLRPDARGEAAMHEGYASVRSLPDVSTEEYEAIVAGRNIVLLNSLLDHTAPDLQAMLPRYTANSVAKLRAYLDTGIYRHDIDGLIPAD